MGLKKGLLVLYGLDRSFPQRGSLHDVGWRVRYNDIWYSVMYTKGEFQFCPSDVAILLSTRVGGRILLQNSSLQGSATADVSRVEGSLCDFNERQKASYSGPLPKIIRSQVVYDLDATGPIPDISEDLKTIQAAERLKRRYAYRFAKRLFDITFSLLVFILFAWLYVVIAISIKIDDPSGPVLFKQKRIGINRSGEPREFYMYKFRSMVPDAESRLQGLRELNEKSGPVFKIKEDPRVTRVGKALRKTSLDELPQFFNVLKGDISIVGPRPALPGEVATYTQSQRLRLLIKPGITCYWQTRRNRDSISFEEWVALDKLYVVNCGIWSDFKILVQTIGVVLTAQGS